MRRALIAAAKTAPIAVAIDATGCSVHGPQQEVACSFVVWCPECWPTIRDGGSDAHPKPDTKEHAAGKDGG